MSSVNGGLSPAPGWPGIGPTWSSSAKDAVGTSVVASRVWFTVGHGILNEVYWPRVDRPQIRDLGFIVADGAGFWSEVKRDADAGAHYPSPASLPSPWSTVTRRMSSPFASVSTTTLMWSGSRPASLIAGHRRRRRRVRRPRCASMHCSPRISGSAASATAPGSARTRAGGCCSRSAANRRWRSRRTRPLPRLSVGYVGASDGWQDFDANGRMTWRHDSTEPGNVAGMAELDLDDGRVQLALAFGARPEQAALQVSASLAGHFQNDWDAYVEAWSEFGRSINAAATAARGSGTALCT